MGDSKHVMFGHGDRGNRRLAWVPAFAGMTTRVLAGMTMGAMALALPAFAQPAPAWKVMTSKQLATACHATDPGQHANCIGYVAGIYDLQFAPTPPRGVCPPNDLTPELLAEVVTAYVDTHEDGPAPAAIGQAIVRFFPCPEPRK
jgi:hypothetical protein